MAESDVDDEFIICMLERNMELKQEENRAKVAGKNGVD